MSGDMHASKLTAEQRQCCVLIGRGLTYAEAAAELQVCERTIYRWYAHPNGIGAAMAHWTKVYTDQYAAALLGRGVKLAEAAMSAPELDTALKAFDLLAKRCSWVEKRNVERDKLQLDRERFEESKRQASMDLGGSASGLQRIVIPEDSVLEATGETPPSSARPPREAG